MADGSGTSLSDKRQRMSDGAARGRGRMRERVAPGEKSEPRRVKTGRQMRIRGGGRRPPAQCGALRRKTAQKHSPRNEAGLRSRVFAAMRPGPGHRQAVAGPPPALISHEKLQRATKTAVAYEHRRGCFGLGCSV